MKTFKTFTEAFNVGIASSDDADVQKMVTYLQSLSTGKDTEIVMTAQPVDKPKYKIKTHFDTSGHADAIKKFQKDNDLSIR